MQGIYNYVPETNQLQLTAHVMLLTLLNVLNIYIGALRSMRAVPNRAVFCSYYYYYYCKLEVRYSYSLLRWSNPTGKRDFPHPSKQARRPTHPPVPWVQGLFPGDEAAGAWHWSCTPSSAEVKGRVQLYPYSTSWPS